MKPSPRSYYVSAIKPENKNYVKLNLDPHQAADPLIVSISQEKREDSYEVIKWKRLDGVHAFREFHRNPVEIIFSDKAVFEIQGIKWVHGEDGMVCSVECRIKKLEYD